MNKYEILKQVFGYPKYRPGQEELIDTILSGRDVLGIMPTGAGKSICYQIPALLMPGITLVVSPLISLMIDQVKALNRAGVHAAYINSALTERQIDKALSLAAMGQYKIIYVAPERLLTRKFLNFVSQVELSMVTVDEAHCISHWGQDFRPSYLEITEFLGRLQKRPVVSAFTATATERVRRDIEAALELRDPKRLVTGFDRENLYFSVKHYVPKLKSLFVVRYLTDHPGESGIIYCATRKNVDSLCELLTKNGLPVARYHAGMTAEERNASQTDFVYDRVPVIIATNAFGMGIDKSNVRFVIHYNMPQSVENYYQEAGRAGRDGEPAECILLYTAQDIVINRLLLQSKENPENYSLDEKRLQLMIRYCTEPSCLRERILRYFGERDTVTCDNCSFCTGEETEDVSGVSLRGTKGKGKAAGVDAKYKAFFEQLKIVRKELASRDNVPPYIIFSDNTLADLCKKAGRIHKEEDLLLVSGIGAVKLEQYGAAFFEAVCSWQKSGGLEEDTEREEKTVKTSAKKKEEFSVTNDMAERVEYTQSCLIADFALQLNGLRDEALMKKTSGAELFRRLVAEGFAAETEDPKDFSKKVTEKGLSFGLSEVERTTRGGIVYTDLALNQQAQKQIVDWYRRNDRNEKVGIGNGKTDTGSGKI